MLRHAIIFTIGAIIGAATMLMRAAGPEEPPAASTTAAAPTPQDRARASTADPAPDASARLPFESAEPGGAAEVQVPDRMPVTYQDMIGPPPRRVDASQLHERFEQESRDEAWAFAMETGVHNHIRQARADDVFVEYVECRTTMCEIAGFETGTGRGFTTTFQDMPTAGWWQADGPVVYLTGEAAGLRRFVVMVGRYAEDRAR